MIVRSWGPAIFWMALIFFLSSLEQLPSPEQRWLDFVLEKSAHTLEYAILAVLLLRALGGRQNQRGWRIAGAALCIAWLYALTDEFHQSFVPGRAADWIDVVFDWLGAIVGIWLWQIGWRPRRNQVPSEKT